jgi:16S rRNA (cytidine1402-2'-O)-methyltransferase
MTSAAEGEGGAGGERPVREAAGARAGTLVLVGTPLGNRDDLAPRARRALLEADLLLCEDTRSPQRLLGEGAPRLPPRVSCFVGNEHDRVPLLLERLARGERVVFVSEAGLPMWSDPGATLVRAAVDAGYAVDVIPGPTAAAVAVCHAGFPAERVVFVGFPPRGGKEREALLASLAGERGVAVLYEAGNRTPALLRDLAAVLPDAAQRRVAVARELTKLHQEVARGSVAELALARTDAERGEVTVVLEGHRPAAAADAGQAPVDPAHAAARAVLDVLLDSQLRPKARARALAELTGLEPKAVYARLVAAGGAADD